MVFDDLIEAGLRILGDDTVMTEPRGHGLFERHVAGFFRATITDRGANETGIGFVGFDLLPLLRDELAGCHLALTGTGDDLGAVLSPVADDLIGVLVQQRELHAGTAVGLTLLPVRF